MQQISDGLILSFLAENLLLKSNGMSLSWEVQRQAFKKHLGEAYWEQGGFWVLTIVIPGSCSPPRPVWPCIKWELILDNSIIRIVPEKASMAFTSQNKMLKVFTLFSLQYEKTEKATNMNFYYGPVRNVQVVCLSVILRHEQNAGQSTMCGGHSGWRTPCQDWLHRQCEG